MKQYKSNRIRMEIQSKCDNVEACEEIQRRYSGSEINLRLIMIHMKIYTS
jgi:hypothetical protein